LIGDPVPLRSGSGAAVKLRLGRVSHDPVAKLVPHGPPTFTRKVTRRERPKVVWSLFPSPAVRALCPERGTRFVTDGVALGRGTRRFDDAGLL